MQQERRKFNDEIEDSYIMASQASANCVTSLAIGKGNLSGLYRDFFQYFYHLFDLTHDIKEISEKEEKLCKTILVWFIEQHDLSSKPDKEIVKLTQEGNDLFRKYKKALMVSGVITLPTSKR
jgi:hypothetical protein